MYYLMSGSAGPGLIGPRASLLWRPLLKRRGRRNLSVKSFSGPEKLEDIKKDLRAVGAGGRVTLRVNANKPGLANITLSNPGRKNAITGHMMADFHDALLQLEEWTSRDMEVVKALLVQTDSEQGGTDVFCSGGDLNTVRAILTSHGGHDMATLMHDVFIRLHSLPALTATLVEGRAIGGGAELATLTDFRAFGSSGALRYVQSKMGVSPGWSGGFRLVQLVGPARALRLLSSGEIINRDEAVELGLCDKKVDSNEEAEEWLWSLVKSLDPQVVRVLKAVVLNAGNSSVSMKDKLAEEARLFSQLWGGSAHRKAMNKGIKH
jgi:ethylmalonyl-CoA/methylmalonyl-CoA decarboxylase